MKTLPAWIPAGSKFGKVQDAGLVVRALILLIAPAL